MFCSKCSYTSFDHLTQCPKCGYDWAEERRIFNVEWVQAPGDSWMFTSQAGENEETEVSGDGYREGSRMEVTTRSAKEDNTYTSNLSPEKHQENHEVEEEDSEFSLDLGSELEPYEQEEHVRPRAGRTSSMEDEIEFPDLDISTPDNNEK